jgi:two-component system, cell cycle sensor histidine kinase and response regulator CckA
MDSPECERLETILVVEDTEPIRRMVCSMLCFSGYNCLEAADGREALRIVQRDPGLLDLILTDVVMPEMGGPELAVQVGALRPDLPIVFMSGYSDDPVVRTLERSPALFLPKPFTATALSDTVRAALQREPSGLQDAQTNSAQ